MKKVVNIKTDIKTLKKSVKKTNLANINESLMDPLLTVEQPIPRADESAMEPLAKTTGADQDEYDDKGALWLWPVGAALLAGGIAAALSNNNDDSPAAEPFTLPLTLQSSDNNGNGKPEVTGSTAPNATVKVTLPNGDTTTTVADSNGKWSVESPTIQKDGQIKVEVKDQNGNTVNGETTYKDTTPPATPTLNITPKNDGGLTAEGTAEPGSTVTVKFPSGATATTIADPSGKYGPVSSGTANEPTGNVTATAKDPAGNVSPQATKPYADTIAPAAPTIDKLTPEADGGLTAEGTAEPGSTVTVKFPSGATATTIADPSGKYGPVSSGTANEPTGNVTATAKDPAGNVSPQATKPYADTIAPAAPTIDKLTPEADGGLTAEGTAEPGSTVTVKFPSGATATTIADSSGKYGPVSSGTANEPTGNVTATAKDPAGNVSPQATKPYADTIAPAAPTIDKLTPENDGGLTAEGTAEPGSTVTVKFPSGATATTIADPSGKYGPVSSGTANEPTGNVTATAKDPAGNSSPETTKPYGDNTAPAAPTIDKLTPESDGGLTAEGTAEPGSTVTVKFPSGATATTVADPSGKYGPVSSGTANEPTGNVTATAKDPAGNVSPQATKPYADTIAPAAPTIDKLTPENDGGLIAEGTAEPGSTVTVKFPSGATATTVADPSGKYGPVSSGTANEPTGNVTATAKDPAGNVSPQATKPYADTIAPAAPTIDKLTPEADGGLTAEGTAEPGSTVTVKFPSGATATTIADPSGKYGPVSSGTANEPTGNVTATAKDPAGNVSPQATKPYADTIAPAAPTIDKLTPENDGGLTAEGTAEPGSTVTVKFPSGATATTIADPSGKYGPVSSGTANEPTGNVTATAKDPAGNSSPETTKPYGDNTAPAAPTIDKLTPESDGGLTAEGTAEPGSTVTVKFPSGATATTIADPSGKYGPVSSGTANEPTGNVTATAKDPAGNVSPQATKPYADTIAPAAPTIDKLTPEADGGLTAEGTAEPGSTVTVKFPSGATATTIADPLGKYGPVSSGTANEPTGNVTATAKDPAGNVSPQATKPYADTIAPSTTVSINSISNDTGTPNDFITTDNNGLTIHASLDKPLSTNETLYYSKDNGATWTAVNASVSGTTIAHTDPTLTVTNTVLFEVRDSSGNVGPQESQLITIVPTPPQATLIGYYDDVGNVGLFSQGFGEQTKTITNDASVKLHGALSRPLTAGEVVEVYADGVLVGTTTSTYSGAGTWSYTLSPTTTSKTYTVKVADTYGNSVAGTGTQVLALDNTPSTTVAKPVSILDNVASTTGTIVSNSYATITNDDTPLVQGTLSAPLVAGETVRVYMGTDNNGAVYVGTATVSGTTWTYQATTPTGHYYEFAAQVMDEAFNDQTNMSFPTYGLRFTVDTSQTTKPVSIDLNNDGQVEYNTIQMDVTNDGISEQTAWVGANDGVLVFDKNADGIVAIEDVSFVQYGGNTDLEGVAAGFDSNHDGVLNASDALFDQFSVWQDANQNGLTDAGELKSLLDLHIASIDLHSDNVSSVPFDGVHVHGNSIVTLDSGIELLAQDVSFAYQHNTII